MRLKSAGWQLKTAIRRHGLTQGRDIAAKTVVLGMKHLESMAKAVKGGVDQEEPCMTQCRASCRLRRMMLQ